MGINKNSVWHFEGLNEFQNGMYRIIEIFPEIDCVIIFNLENTSSVVRLKVISLSYFSQEVEKKCIYKSSFPLPFYLLINEDELSESHRVRRDKNFSLIQDLVCDKDFLLDYSLNKRGRGLVVHSIKVNSDRKTLSRLLSRYWRYGQNKMAMHSAFACSGAAGKDRQSNERFLGAPKISRTLAVERSTKYNLDKIDKDKIRKSLKEFYLKSDGESLAKTYQMMLKKYYSEEVIMGHIKSCTPHTPTKKQFYYWARKLFSKDEIILARTTERDYLQNKRAVLGSVTQASILPGSFFEIDATVADVHIVSEFGSQYVLGRPTIYVVVDRASRMIAGIHVSLFHASWRAARQALANCFLPKTDYCKQFGIIIDESEWPCAHIPQSLVCDNGEMIGLKPNHVVTPITELKFTPPYRPDCKGIVEKCFDILNKDIIHSLLGTTRGGKVICGSRDPRKDSIYTLRNLTVHLIQAVLEHNRSLIDSLALTTPLLIENDLAPTPINYWKIHLVKHRHALKLSDTSEVIARLLPSSEVSMTRSGIFYNGLYYSCEQVEELNLASIARASGRWRLEARIDENTTDFIYVRLDKNKGFIKCYLLPRSRILEGKSMIEAEFIQDWIDIKRECNPISVESIDDHRQRAKMKKNAIKESQLSSAPMSEKVKNVRQHRTNEMLATTNTERQDGIPPKAIDHKYENKDNVHRILPRRSNRGRE